MHQHSGYLTFRIDNTLSGELRKSLEGILADYRESVLAPFDPDSPQNSNILTIDFISESSLHLLKPGPNLKICLLDRNQGLFSFGQNIDESHVDAVLDDTVDLKQVEKILEPKLDVILRRKEKELLNFGIKNLKRFETKAKLLTQKSLESEKDFTSDSLLEFAQALVDLERDLIHSDDLMKIEKVLKHFVKNHLGKTRFSFYTSSQLWKVSLSKNLLVLPRYRGEFLVIELSWEDEDRLRLIQKSFFFYTLIGFFQSQQEIADPFFDENLWEGVLDSIPFPVALLSTTAEVYQHNTLFAKLGYPPVDCLKLSLREKISINDIPYNVFRKDIFHLDEKKYLFVFFTESFFLKGDGNLTPSGQELGIISSSIAHELNNPIAGIQAALTLLMLEEDMEEEAKQTLLEMKNGAVRCKQLVETFLGFSRANPHQLQPLESKLSPIEICYQQAQNLLRFRTVESGIRFSFEYSRHTEFRATVNVSLLTMTFYLILGELMTLYSHHLLVSNKNQIEKVIRGELIESSQEIQIQLHELNISTLSLSKLIQNLLTIEDFVLQVSDYSLRFIYSPSRDV